MQINGVQTAQPTEYVFDNSGMIAEAHYCELSRLYDANTIRHLKQRGIQKGWSCLEVGGGGGSIASWFCLRVGITGRVLATDIDPRFLNALSFPNLEVRRHDIRTEGLPTSEFDLAHARLVLMHLPERETALRRMIDSLKPGGWLVVEEFDTLSFLPDPVINPSEANLKLKYAFHEVLTARGVDLRYGRLLAHRLQAHGLVNVGAEAGKCAGTALTKLKFEEMRASILSSGLMSPEEFDADLKSVQEQDCSMPSPMMWTTWGMKIRPDGGRSPTDEFIYW